MIMRGEKGVGIGAWQRAAVSGLAVAALALTVGAGLFGRGASPAGARMLEGAGGEPQDAKRVDVRVRQRGGERRAQELEERRAYEQAVAEVMQAQEAMVFFEQPTGGPVAVTAAKMRMITREQLRRADAAGADNFDDEEAAFFLTLPTITLANTSPKAIREVGIGFETGGRLSVIAGYAASMKPGESETFRSEWRYRNVIFPGTFADVKVRVIWVEFEDGTQWGPRARAPHPPEPPPPPRRPGEPPPPPSEGGSGEGGDTLSVRVMGSGRSEDVAVARSGGGAVARSADVGEGSGEGGGGAVARSGGGRKSAGLGDKKLYAPEPTYPPIAKAAGAQGTVSVKVTVDEAGNVIAAEAVSGHPLLRSAAVDAARESKFKPTVVDGKPVRVTAVISYDFTLK